MDTTKLKKFAQYARTLLIEQVGTKLNQVLAAESPARREAPKAVSSLESQIKKLGETQLIDQVAYTWFNRFCALRFMDVNGYNRVQVLSPLPGQFQPEILTEAKMGLIDDEHGTPSIRQHINDLLGGKLQSHDPQGEAYRLLVVAACNSWHRVMPFMFEKIADYTELLLPDDLLSGNSILSYTREALTAANCSPENTDESVEVLGWLYQFYIAEKKDAVMARKKAVASEDIPAVTQLFTPHWIVRYLVENSLGRLWLRSRPHSRLRDKEHMPYYVEDPEGQTPADNLTVATPEEIKLLDPACGSGHMLTYAFDLLMKIYEDEGHAKSDIPEKILTHNLFGLEICPRAAQLAQFALVCKAREQSRAAFRRPVQPQVICLQNVVFEEGELERYASETGHFKLTTENLAQLHQFRENTETFGSLIQPVLDGGELAAFKAKIGEQSPAGDLLVQNTHRKLRLVLDQAEMLSQRYQVAVLNPPYMGLRTMNAVLKSFVESKYSEGKADLFSAMMLRGNAFLVHWGYTAMVTMQSWMFLPSFSDLRFRIIKSSPVLTMAHLGARGFDSIGGEVVQTTAFICCKEMCADAEATYFRLIDGKNEAEKAADLLARRGMFLCPASRFLKINDQPIVYWASKIIVSAFEKGDRIEEIAKPRQGLSSSDNDRFLRFWHEAPISNIGFGCRSTKESATSKERWFPFNKGGTFRKWHGNNDYVVNWENDGKELKEFAAHLYGSATRTIKNIQFYFRPGITWSRISTGTFCVRLSPEGFIFSDAGCCAFPDSGRDLLAAFMNSAVAQHILSLLNPTLTFQVGDIKNLPLLTETAPKETRVSDIVQKSVHFARADWDNFETSWDFSDLPLLRPGDWEVEPSQPGGPWKGRTLAESWTNYAAYCTAAIRRLQELETENNRLWIDAYGLQDELDPAVPEKEITLARADARKDMAAFLSYAVGCMMGRYSLDHPGLILANAGDTLERYFEKINKLESEVRFLPDDDSIVPILDGDWFDDDITERFKKFLKASFGEEHYEENLEWLENALFPTNLEGKKRKSIRDYFLKDFYADHVQTYKKRPIYWLFSSPKGSFNALVYLHRYTKDTVSLVLNDYLREFKTKLTAKMENLQHLEASTDASKKDKADALKEIAQIKKILTELNDWEKDTLFPLAQQQLEIDLDDGVKHNYPLFGNALKKVPGLS